ncbi:MAG: hypothetical protein ICV61_03330 [Microcoleus sp. Co-bin12]|nr:hypothetical protein [Microcoleus sp. Co-bin12]
MPKTDNLKNPPRQLYYGRSIGDDITSDRAIDNFRVGKRHGDVSRVALLSMRIFDRQFLRQHTIYSGSIA